MSQRILLAPCSNEAGRRNLGKSIENLVGPEVYRKYSEFDFDKPIGIWGTGKHNKGKWERIDKGDFMLFYVGNWNYKYAGIVVYKEINVELAEKIWTSQEEDELAGPIGERSWKHLIYLDNIQEVNINSKELHTFANYVRMFPMQFKFLPGNGIDAIKKEYGSIERFIYGNEDSSR